MALDDLELSVIQPPGLVENRRRRVDLPDVVEQGCGAHLDYLCLRQVELSGDHNRAARHAMRMAVGVRIAGLERARELGQELLAPVWGQIRRLVQADQQANGAVQLPLDP